MSLLKRFSRSAQRAVPCGFPHDAIPVFVSGRLAVRLAGISLVGENALRTRAVDHASELRAFGGVRRLGLYLVDETFFIAARECFVSQSALAAFLDPTGIRIGAELHLGIAIALLTRFLFAIRGASMCLRGRAALSTSVASTIAASACFSFSPCASG